MQARRSHFSESERQKASDCICQKIGSLTSFHQAQTIALYRAFKAEVDVTTLWNLAIFAGKRCFFPVVRAQHLLFLPAEPANSFSKNTYGILEPQTNFEQAIAPEKLDMMVLPLLAFDEQGHRVGSGGGYYDRVLSQQKPKLLVGVAYEFQKENAIIADSWDVPLNVVITEKNTYWINP